jgi:hypothetical protein
MIFDLIFAHNSLFDGFYMLLDCDTTNIEDMLHQRKLLVQARSPIKSTYLKYSNNICSYLLVVCLIHSTI